MKTHITRTTLSRSRIVLGTLLAWLLGLNLPPALAGPGAWTRKADMPAVVGAAAGCALDGILYVAAGESSIGGLVGTMFAYDPRTDAWTRKADMPTPRAGPVAGAVDGIVYVIGGGSIVTEMMTGVVEAYDPKTDTWSTKSPMPTKRASAAVATLDGLIYVMGGYGNGITPLATVECYDPKTDQWTRKRSLPETARPPVAQVVKGRIYLFNDTKHTFEYDPTTDRWTRMVSRIPTGFDCHGSAAGTVDGVVYLFGGLCTTSPFCAQDLTLAYDPVRDEDGFAPRRMMPEPCALPAYATIDGQIYLAGGNSGWETCPEHTISKSLWVFDPYGTPGSWTRKADMPAVVGAAAGCALDGILYVAAGESSRGGLVQTMFAYDPRTDAWTRKAEMPTPRAAPVAGAVDGIVYVIGGGSIVTGVMTDVVEAYDPKTDTWSTKSPMPTERCTAAVATLDGLIYVMGGYGNGITTLATVVCYDPKTDQWTPKASLPEPARPPVAQVVKGRIYLFNDTKHILEYDPTTDRWTRMASTIPSGFDCHGSAAGTVDDVVYLFGSLSFTPPNCAQDLTLAYDPVPDRFTPRRMMPEPCALPAYATIDGKIFLAGGFSGWDTCPGYAYYKSLWVFDPQGGGGMPRILSIAREANDTVRLVWRAEKGRLYGVRSRTGPFRGSWVNFRLSDGSTTVRAADDVVEATGPVTPADTSRYFRVYEAD